MLRIEQCHIESLNTEDCRAFLSWATGGKQPVSASGKFCWLLAHCQDGVTWGRFDIDSGTWCLSATPYPNLCPAITHINLLELRIFGPESEMLIWRDDDGFKGRQLSDTTEKAPNASMNRDIETRVLIGNQLIDVKNGFTRVGTGTGAEQAVPIECSTTDFQPDPEHKKWPLRLKICHYFAQDEESGAIRVAASRLVDVFKEVK
jgi:CRISPR-associated protein (TIGR03984 family)